ncbi:MAG: hypothetical protein LC749_15065 [Actinobacteria bacterium]|nr:hypothetical protein [Actinomycetota bacterium]
MVRPRLDPKRQFEDNIARRLRPDGKNSPVMIDPEVAFGLPVVRWVRTEIVHELSDALTAAGLSPQPIAP